MFGARMIPNSVPTQTAILVYYSQKGWLFVDSLYVLFGLANLVLGAFILWPDMGLIEALLLTTLLIGALALVLNLTTTRSDHHKAFKDSIRKWREKWGLT